MLREVVCIEHPFIPDIGDLEQFLRTHHESWMPTKSLPAMQRGATCS
jgi:hypothetical protein